MAHRRHTCQPAVVPCLFGKRGRAARSVGRNVGSSLLPTQADEPPRSGRGRGICTLTLPCPPVLSTPHAPVAELVDAPDSKSGGLTPVLVRVRPGAPQQNQTVSGKRSSARRKAFGTDLGAVLCARAVATCRHGWKDSLIPPEVIDTLPNRKVAIARSHSRTPAASPRFSTRVAKLGSSDKPHSDLWATFKFKGQKAFSVPLHARALWRAGMVSAATSSRSCRPATGSASG
jgi:hypothetical protein